MTWKRCSSLLVGIAVVATPAWGQPPNDSCSSPDAIAGYGTFAFDTTEATSEPLGIGCAAGDAFNDVWYCWTAPLSEPVVVDTCLGDTFFDSVIAVYDGCACPAPVSTIACNDDSCGLQSRTNFLAVSGQTYLIRLGGFSSSELGAGTLTISSGIIHTKTHPANGHTYRLFAASTWSAAESIAVAMGGHLVSISDAAENDFVHQQMLGFDGRDRRCWLGFTDQDLEGTFTWTDGSPVTYTNWNSGEPNDFGGNEDYAEMLGSSGTWNDQPDDGNGFVQFGVAEIGGPPACPADFNGDDTVNSQDFFDFLVAFFALLPSADFNDDGTVNSQDFFDFLVAFFAGC
jgi:hypothetical protein